MACSHFSQGGGGGIQKIQTLYICFVDLFCDNISYGKELELGLCHYDYVFGSVQWCLAEERGGGGVGAPVLKIPPPPPSPGKNVSNQHLFRKKIIQCSIQMKSLQNPINQFLSFWNICNQSCWQLEYYVDENTLTIPLFNNSEILVQILLNLVSR